MSSQNPTPPSFTFGYWRPWKEDSNLFDSYLDYVKDTSLVKYGADTIGEYIGQASQEQLRTINQLGQTLGRGMNALSDQMSEIKDSLDFINRNLDLQIEQQKLSNLMLQNISELLRIPDIEKERQHNIEIGLKFFLNAQSDSDLYSDALTYLSKAESIMPQDYFVSHRLGCIYLYAEKHLDPEKAILYFKKAAKYARVESDPQALKLINALYKNFKSLNSDNKNFENQIGILAADSFEKAAFASYVLGKFQDSVELQSEAVKCNPSHQNRFTLAKYQVRNNQIDSAVENLDKCLDTNPELALATFKELDLINEPAITSLIAAKNELIDNKIKALAERIVKINSNLAVILNELLSASYEVKVDEYKLLLKTADNATSEFNKSIKDIDSLINKINSKDFSFVENDTRSELVRTLHEAKDLPFEQMKISSLNAKQKFESQIQANSQKKAVKTHEEDELKKQKNTDEKILNLCKAGKYIEAINYKRTKSHTSFEASKKYVDNLCAHHDIKIPVENSSKKCFVITATMGDPNHPVVEEFRKYRDAHLLTNKPGQILVRFYYKTGPYLALLISKSSLLRKLSFSFFVNPMYKKIRNKNI
jgi:tetratricopeptide (TPR) repeat protein